MWIFSLIFGLGHQNSSPPWWMARTLHVCHYAKCSPTNTGLTRFGFTELFMSLCHFCFCLNGLVLSRLCLCATHFYGWSCTCICLSSGRRNWGKVIKKNIRGMGIYFWNRNYSLLLWQKTNSCITVYCLNLVDGYEPFLLVHILRIRGLSYVRYFDLCCMVFHWFQGWCQFPHASFRAFDVHSGFWIIRKVHWSIIK